MPDSKKVVIKADIHDENVKWKALKAVSSLSGIESLSMDMNVKKLTIIGDIDPVAVVRKLKKWHPNILTVGPAKEEKESEKKENDGEKKEEDEEAIRRCMEACRFNNPWMRPAGLCVHVMEDDPDPTGCVIC